MTTVDEIPLIFSCKVAFVFSACSVYGSRWDTVCDMLKLRRWGKKQCFIYDEEQDGTDVDNAPVTSMKCTSHIVSQRFEQVSSVVHYCLCQYGHYIY